MNEKTCLVIPCFNEECRLPLSEFKDFLYRQASVYFCFVNDGSADKTLEILLSLKREFPEQVMVIDQPENQGKAESVRNGLLKSYNWEQFDYMGFFDADLATPLSQFNLLLEGIKSKDSLIVCIGSRWQRLGSDIVRKPFRHYIGRFFATMVSIVLRTPVYDSQCGAKIFKSSYISKLFSEPLNTTWLFDVEILARLISLNRGTNIHNLAIEIPLKEWKEKGASKISPLYFFKAPVELLRIHNKYQI